MSAKKKEVKKISYEDYDIAKDKSLNKAVANLATAFNTKLFVSKVRGKSMVGCIEAAIPVTRFEVGKHIVEACVDTILWNNRLHGGVVSVSVVVDGNVKDAELKFDCLYPDKDGQMVYEVVEDVSNFVVDCAYHKACAIEPKN